MMNEYELLGKYAKTVASGKDMYIKKFNIPGLKKYLREYEQTLIPIFQNYRLAREVRSQQNCLCYLK